MSGFNNFPSYHLRVGDVVSDLLEGLAGSSIGRDWLRRQQGYEVAKAEAKKWWGKARKVGEETYLLDHVLISDSTQTEPYVSDHLLRVIQAKYAQRIPSLYRKVLDERPDVNSGSLPEAVLESKMPDKEKIDLLIHGATHEKTGQRPPALWAIRQLDKKLFCSHLMATLEKIPEDLPGPYWTSPEPRIASLAIECDNPNVWSMVERVAKRSAVGLRMELISHFGENLETRHTLERLRLLANFLDDSSSREIGVSDMKGKFSGPCAGFIYPKLEVRNFAALEIAEILGMEIERKPERTAEEWAKIRETVREKLKKELASSPPRVGPVVPR